MHFDHRQRIPFTVGKQGATQLRCLITIRKRVGRQPYERSRRCQSIGNAIQIVVTKPWAECRADVLDGIAEVEVGVIDGSADDRQEVGQPGDDCFQCRAQVGEQVARSFNRDFS